MLRTPTSILLELCRFRRCFRFAVFHLDNPLPYELLSWQEEGIGVNSDIQGRCHGRCDSSGRNLCQVFHATRISRRGCHWRASGSGGYPPQVLCATRREEDPRSEPNEGIGERPSRLLRSAPAVPGSRGALAAPQAQFSIRLLSSYDQALVGSRRVVRAPEYVQPIAIFFA